MIDQLNCFCPQMFQRNLVTRSILEEVQEDEDRLELEQPRDEEESRIHGKDLLFSILIIVFSPTLWIDHVIEK